MLKLEGINKTFYSTSNDKNALFQNFSLNVKKGDFISLIGSNGSGKTSLLNIICGSIAIDCGNIVLNGNNISKMPEHKRYMHIGRVFQDPSLGTCPSMTILENLSMADDKHKPFNLSSGIKFAKKNAYKEMLASLGIGLENKLDTMVGNLSGGQRQALALLMASLSDVDLLLLDEHTAALDPKTADTIMRLSDNIIKQKGITSLMVTHNLRYALEYGNRMLMLHEGKIVLDIADEDKKSTELSSVLSLFNSISIECGN